MKNDEISHEGIYWHILDVTYDVDWFYFLISRKNGAKLREACEQCLIPDLNSCAVHVEITATNETNATV